MRRRWFDVVEGVVECVVCGEPGPPLEYEDEDGEWNDDPGDPDGDDIYETTCYLNPRCSEECEQVYLNPDLAVEEGL